MDTSYSNYSSKSNKQFYLPPPSIKSRDTRCSTRCSKNWTKYGQKPPVGHYCECTSNCSKLI